MCGDGKEAFRFICFDESCNECEHFKFDRCQVKDTYCTVDREGIKERDIALRPRPVQMPAYGRD